MSLTHQPESNVHCVSDDPSCRLYQLWNPLKHKPQCAVGLGQMICGRKTCPQCGWQRRHGLAEASALCLLAFTLAGQYICAVAAAFLHY